MPAPVLGIIAPHAPIMVPDVGGSKAMVTAGSIEALRIAEQALRRFAPDTLVVISPHAPRLSDAFAVDTTAHAEGSFAEFGAVHTRISVSTDVEFAERLLDLLGARGIPGASRAEHPHLRPGVLDHGVLVPLSILDPRGTIPCVGLSVSDLSHDHHRQLGAAVGDVAELLGRRVAFLASGDLSHRLTPQAPAGYSPRGAEFDEQVVGLLRAGNLDAMIGIDADLVREAGECGLRPLIALSGALPNQEVRFLHYEAPWGVGYVTALAGRRDDIGPWEHEVVRLARHAIETYVVSGTTVESPRLADPTLPSRAGVFVSLHCQERLRGCVGTVEPIHRDLATEIVSNAIKAASTDPRFPAVAPHELSGLRLKVDIVGPRERCAFEDLDPAVFGVVVSAGSRRGVLLPDIDGVDSPTAQVRIALRKAAIHPDEPYELERFRVERYA